MKEIIFVATLGISAISNAEIINGVELPQGAASFADSVVSYSPGANLLPSYRSSSDSLGQPDFNNSAETGYTSLGSGGELVLKFTDNILTRSNDSSIDLWIFEIGESLEPVSVYISDDNQSWLYVGDASGGTRGIDIDKYLTLESSQKTNFSFVKLIDLSTTNKNSLWAGADIDAVAAITSKENQCAPNNSSPATYDHVTGKLHIPYVLSNGKCYELNLNGSSGLNIESNEHFIKDNLKNK